MKRALVLLILGTVISGIAAYAASARPAPEALASENQTPETKTAR
jgi:hypothetical protein